MTMLDDQAENRRLHERLRLQSLRRQVADAGRKLGARSPERLWRMVDPDQVDFDELTDTVMNAEALVADLTRTDSYLFSSLAEEPSEVRQAVQPEAARSDGSRRRFDMNEQLRAALPRPVKGVDLNAELRQRTGRGGGPRQT